MTIDDRDHASKQRKETTINIRRVIGILALGVAALFLVIIQSAVATYNFLLRSYVGGVFTALYILSVLIGAVFLSMEQKDSG